MSIKKIFENSNQDNDPNAGIDWQWKGHDKHEKKQEIPTDLPNTGLPIQYEKSYPKTLFKKTQAVKNAAQAFADYKSKTPTGRWGKSDKPFESSSPLSGFKHAHLDFDISMVYKIDGGKLKLYGLYSHDDLGTGTPGNINKQKSMGARFNNAVFEAYK